MNSVADLVVWMQRDMAYAALEYKLERNPYIQPIYSRLMSEIALVRNIKNKILPPKE